MVNCDIVYLSLWCAAAHSAWHLLFLFLINLPSPSSHLSLLCTRTIGSGSLVDLTVLIDEKLSATAAHAIGERARWQIMERLPQVGRMVRLSVRLRCRTHTSKSCLVSGAGIDKSYSASCVHFVSFPYVILYLIHRHQYSTELNTCPHNPPIILIMLITGERCTCPHTVHGDSVSTAL
jgi:Dimerisation domain of Zinc Transporter